MANEDFASAVQALDPAAFRAVFEQAPQAMIVLDRGGLVLMWNRAAEELTGWAASEVLGKLVPYIPNERMDSFRARHEEAFAGAPLVEIVIQRVTRSGERREISLARNALRDASGNIIGILGMLTDVTDKRIEEATQRRAEANLRAIIERAPDAMLVHRMGQVVYTNPKALALLGVDSSDEMIGRSMFRFIHPADHAVVAERARRTMETGVESPPLEERVLRADGTEIPCEITGIPLVFDGQPSILVQARDLRERKQLEAQLRTADRLASLGRLAAGVGHEINNPLSYVMGNLELLDQALGDVEPVLQARLRELMSDAHEGAERVRLIVRDLKVFSRGDAEEKDAVDVRRVLDSCVNMAMAEIRQSATLEKRYLETAPVFVNEARLAQVFLNLLINAAQAIPEGRADAHTIVVSTRTGDGGHVIVEVKDDGIGMAPEVLPRVFEPFFTSRRGRGTGLGMAICQTLLTEMGGTIALESAVGKGTKVTVVLPPATLDSVPAILDVPEPSPPKPARRRILVVDDERLVASTVASILSDHETDVVTSGRDAIARIDTESYDLILCDLMMPEIGGIDLYEHVRTQWPGREERFVFMTGGAFTPRASKFLDQVQNAWIEKPFRIDDLLALVTRVLDELAG